MPRNLYERVEVMFPLKDALARERVRHEILDAYLVDNAKSRVLRKEAVYVRSWQAEGKRKAPVGAEAFSAQDFLLGLAEGKQAVEAMPVPVPRRARRVAMSKGR
jgi:polyphosphate kinase